MAKRRHDFNRPQQNQETAEPMTTEPALTSVPDAPAAPEPQPNGKVEINDLRVLQLAFKEFENAALKHQLAQAAVDNAVRTAEAAKQELLKLNDAVNQKYGLNPAKDRINLQDGSITKG